MEEHGTNTSRLLAERMDCFFKLGAELKIIGSNVWILGFKIYNAVVDLRTRISQKFKTG
ncbi:hypothetical protein IFR05_008448 [Cadophora sp. M221]|nr:hypothetical protein IFR05_008448 [Cadophora sp. M221]